MSCRRYLACCLRPQLLLARRLLLLLIGCIPTTHTRHTLLLLLCI
jgi:hypothetical protein